MILIKSNKYSIFKNNSVTQMDKEKHSVLPAINQSYLITESVLLPILAMIL